MAAADTSPFQGIVGNLSSGKSALVHRYLTGTYVQEESPEGAVLGALAPPPGPKGSPHLSLCPPAVSGPHHVLCPSHRCALSPRWPI